MTLNDDTEKITQLTRKDSTPFSAEQAGLAESERKLIKVELESRLR